AVFFGVAMVSGTLLINESVTRSFDNLFGEINQGIDVTVRERMVVEDPFDQGPAGGFDAALLDQVSKVEGVEEAEGTIADIRISILGDDDERIGPPSGGPPHIALGVTKVDEFAALTVIDGEEPNAPDEVAIDQDSAENEGFEIGDQVTITGAAGASDYSIVGITQFGSGDTSLGASLAQFTLPEAQRLTGKEGRFDEIDIAATEGTTPEELAPRIARAVGPRFDVQTGEETAETDTTDITDDFSFLTTALLVFAGIAVFVGGFLIFNTFSITVAQRTREFAMLRLLGASSRQVLAAVMAEAALIGLLASLMGIAGGFGFVELVKLMFKGIGFELPVTSLRLETVSVVVPLLVGMIATLLSAMAPAVRATRVAPLEALRESGGSTQLAERTSRRRSIIAGALVCLALGLLGFGLFGADEEGSALSAMGGGLVLLFIGLAMLGGRFVPPIASAIGAPIERLRGITGMLARENAQREPSRTATTAAALMIGVALVVFVGVFSASLKASINDSIDAQIAGDLAILNKDGFSPVPDRIADELASIDGIGVVAPTIDLPAGIKETASDELITGLEPETAGQVYNLEWADGSDETLSDLAPGEAIVEVGWAGDNGVEVGDRLSLTGPAGDELRVTVVGSVDDSAGIIIDSLAIPRQTARDELGARFDATVLLTYADGTDAGETRAAVDGFLEERFPDTETRDQAEIKQDQVDQLNQLVSLIYVLLGLSVIVSIFGVVNTLALTILERTRELGMLRAIGTSRRQVRRMVRYESVINALLGTIVGTVVGLLLAVAAVQALKDEGLVLSVPIALPFVVLTAALILGVVAAIRPARRASRLDVIESLQYE
ncbi:MAG: FtsX-like permease family protein, partial [Solirubrobacterales bacterium]